MQPRQAPPEHPFPEYPYQSPLLRFLTNVREHGFALALAATMLAVLVLFLQFERLKLLELSEQAQPLRGGMEMAASGLSGAPDSLALLTVDTYPHRAAMFLDGTPLGLTPLRQISVPPGTYRMEIVKDAYEPVDSTITVLPGQRLMFNIPLDATGEATLPWIAVTSEPPSFQQQAEPARTRRRASTSAPPSAAAPADAPVRLPPAAVQDLTSSRLEVRSEPAGAAVSLGGRFVGYTPLVLPRVAPGEHVLSFRKLGYESPTTLVVLQPGQTVTVSPELRALAGTLKVLAKPWGSIYVNGELMREASNVRYTASLPPGQYRVTVVHPVLGRWETVATIQPGQEASFVVDLNQAQSAATSRRDSGR